MFGENDRSLLPSASLLNHQQGYSGSMVPMELSCYSVKCGFSEKKWGHNAKPSGMIVIITFDNMNVFIIHFTHTVCKTFKLYMQKVFRKIKHLVMRLKAICLHDVR